MSKFYEKCQNFMKNVKILNVLEKKESDTSDDPDAFANAFVLSKDAGYTDDELKDWVDAFE